MFRRRGPHAQVYGYVHKGRAYVLIKTDTHTRKAMLPYVRLMETRRFWIRSNKPLMDFQLYSTPGHTQKHSDKTKRH